MPVCAREGSATGTRGADERHSTARTGRSRRGASPCPEGARTARRPVTACPCKGKGEAPTWLGKIKVS